MRIDTVRYCCLMLEQLLEKKIPYPIFEKALLRKKEELENKQEVFDLKEMEIGGKK